MINLVNKKDFEKLDRDNINVSELTCPRCKTKSKLEVMRISTNDKRDFHEKTMFYELYKFQLYCKQCGSESDMKSEKLDIAIKHKEIITMIPLLIIKDKIKDDD